MHHLYSDRKVPLNFSKIYIIYINLYMSALNTEIID